MLIAKHYPGQFDVAFVCGMNMSSAHTGVVRSNFSIA